MKISPLMAVVAIVSAAASVLIGFAAPADAVIRKPAPVVRACPTSKAVVRPAGLMLACADGNEYLAKLRWASWSSARATATGLLYLNDCTPDCASGHFHAYKATVLLKAVRHVNGLPYFTRYQLVWVAAGKKHIEKGMPISL